LENHSFALARNLGIKTGRRYRWINGKPSTNIFAEGSREGFGNRAEICVLFYQVEIDNVEKHP
jgi:hypothetical protein